MAVEVLAPAPAATSTARTGRRLAAPLLAVALLATFVAARVAGGVSPRWAAAELTFVSLFVESVPFLLVGAGLAALLTGRTGGRMLAAAARRPRLAAALAPLAGGVLPLCDCGLLPLARQLRDRTGGRSTGPFLAGAPLTNPIVVMSTLLAFPGRPGMAVARVGCGLVLAMAVGALAVPAPARSAPEASARCDIDHDHDHAAAPTGWAAAVGTELTRTGPTLALGALAAATVKAALPTSAFVSLSTQPLAAAAAMMALAFVMSICSQADAFVAAALPVGALPRLAFLVLGPVLDLRLATLYRREFGTRWLASYAAVVVPVTLVAATACATAGLV